jgi:hypothetical protein
MAKQWTADIYQQALMQLGITKAEYEVAKSEHEARKAKAEADLAELSLQHGKKLAAQQSLPDLPQPKEN